MILLNAQIHIILDSADQRFVRVRESEDVRKEAVRTAGYKVCEYKVSKPDEQKWTSGKTN